MALDIEGSLCLQLNQSNLNSQQVQIQTAAVTFCCCSIQPFAQVLNVVIKSNAWQCCRTLTNATGSV